MNMKEEWKIYKTRGNNRGPQNTWEVSNLGRVKKNGIILSFQEGNYYIQIAHKYLHRIIAELFIPNPYNKSQVDHIDGNCQNNRVDNLKWVTPKENMNNPITRHNISVNNVNNKDVADKKRQKMLLFYSSEEARELNRLKQIEVQNRPEVQAKRRKSLSIASKESQNRPEVIEKKRQAMTGYHWYKDPVTNKRIFYK